MGALSSLTALAFSALVAARVAADAHTGNKGDLTCEEYLPMWKVATSPSNTYKFSDDRELRADSYSIGGCPEYNSYPTGSQFTGNYTLAGYQTPYRNKECLIRNDEYSSFQAVVLRANGFSFNPKDIDMDDIDSLTGVKDKDSWKESMAIFGMRGSEYVLPSLKLYDGTMLAEKKYTVAAAGMKEMGLPNKKISVPGAEFSGKTLYNCPFGRSNRHSAKCRVTASFGGAPVDTVVVMYAAAQKRIDQNAACFFSELTLKCGCRCSEKTGQVTIYTPVDGSTSECSAKKVDKPALTCDVLGNKVCYHDVSDSWVAEKEGKLPNGNHACSLKPSKITKITSDFKPQNNFEIKPVG